jgi:micrococcal nuclease
MFGTIFRWLFARSSRASAPSQLTQSALGGLHEVKVAYVCDGDTVDVARMGSILRIRLAAIDCPEGDQPWGDNATAGLQRLIGGRYVYLEIHHDQQDKYGRVLATIYAMDDSGELINVNERMVVAGHAWVMRAYFGHLSKNRQHQLNRLERWAKSKRVGLWKTGNPVPPWMWRKTFKKTS